MHRLTHHSMRAQRGITLIESLVAVVVAALGILGVVGVQMRTLTDTQTTVRRAQAIRLIEDLGERMKVNPNALAQLGGYVSGFADTPAVTNCSTNSCSPAALVTHDVAIWKQTVGNTLPLGQASIFLTPGETTDENRRQLGVIISWRENEGIGRKTDDIDATKMRASDGTFSAGTDAGNECPANRTCHLQYIPVAARCAPYISSPGAAPQFFCPGS